ncbi:MAG: DNA cytosine methyltransferase [Actinomycetaceae bacterium]|nr:DNA cytosine methyltransferase [Arcanobacterium sp.]MDD7504687.1 DNA cytosine methyltransferase [Actinomycetaceae bacterium]
MPKGYPGHPKDAGPVTQDLRPLTTLERSLVQTFPSNFKWVGSKTDREQMVGNAVPVNLGTYVAKALIEHIEQSEYHDSEIDSALFQEWLSAEKGLSERSSRDTVSRLSRANKLHPLSSETDLQTYIFELGRKPDFESLSPSVRSQLKRAVKLYSEFRN